MPTDLEIAQSITLRPIRDVAAELGLSEDEIDLYGRYKAKLPLSIAQRPVKGKLVLVTAIHPTAAGEGKTTTSVGLAQALRRMGTNVVLCLREPSLGPVFGVKGGAAGGGYAQVLPMEDINLHFTGDFHAIASAHALLSALLDNHLQQGNALDIDPRRITWPRTIDMNDRALRKCLIGLGGATNGVPREERFIIVPASEVMAIMALASDLDDLLARLSRIVIGSTYDGQFVTAGQLDAAGAMALLLRDALRPNLVQTAEGGPALVHCGPFANIAHGCNSLMATRSALALGDVVVTEAGFGSDLGAEKFFDIKSRIGGLTPAVAVIVATVRALKLHGGASKASLATPDVDAVQRGLANLERHIANVRQFGVPVVVSLNRFTSDSDAELDCVLRAVTRSGARGALCEVWARGGAGGEALATEVLAMIAEDRSAFAPLYDVSLGIREKIGTLVARVYGGDGVDFSPRAERAIRDLERQGLGQTPVCIAKTQYSFSDDPSRLGAPHGFRVHISEIHPAAGAGFVVAQAGDIMTMPGLPAVPAAARIGVDGAGRAIGLF
ncbi:MAG: formate--tetrahydrofolate ligase [Gemmatimonadaceae bacterium]|nr:formate--tetrahydrofolate ligase [Gemmatimonadaceae bacterium]